MPARRGGATAFRPASADNEDNGKALNSLGPAK